MRLSGELFNGEQRLSCLRRIATAAAQSRICKAIGDIAQEARGTSAIFTHGNVIGLFLHSVVSDFGRTETERLTNPDVLKIEWNDACFKWDRDFSLRGLDRIATNHQQAPREEDPTVAGERVGWGRGEAGN